MPKTDFKKTLLVVSAIIIVSHLAYVLLGNQARAAGGTGSAATFANISHGVTCLLMMWLALLFRDHYQPKVGEAFKLYALLTLALGAVCVAVEIPLTTLSGGAPAVLQAMALCWVAFLMWGGMLMLIAWIRISNQAKLEAARDAALEKQKKGGKKK